MKNLTFFKQPILAAVLIFLVISGCKKADQAALEPVISGISTSNGLTGSSVTITGTNFQSDTGKFTVQFNGVSAKIISASATSIVVVVPENATTGKISLTSNGKTVFYPADFTVTLPVPVINDVLITPLDNGCLIRITGNNFNPDITKNVVKFGDKLATVVGVSATQLFARANIGKTLGQVMVTAYGKTLTNPTGFDFSPYTTAGYKTPSEVSYLSVDASGNVYGTSGNLVVKVSPLGAISTLATIGSSKALLKGSAVDAVGNVYATNNSDCKIYKINPAGVVSTFAGSGTSGYADGPSGSAKFIAPVGLTIDGSGNLFVCDSARVRKITPAGIVSTFAGSNNSGSADGQGLSATFSSLTTITADKDDNIYVNNASGLLRKLTPGGTVTTLDLWGPKVGDGGFNKPVWPHGITSGTQIAADRSGNLFVCNTQGIVYGTTNANAGLTFPIYIIDPSGFVEVFSSASFAGYLGITSDKAGSLYLSQKSYAYSGSFITKYYIP